MSTHNRYFRGEIKKILLDTPSYLKPWMHLVESLPVLQGRQLLGHWYLFFTNQSPSERVYSKRKESAPSLKESKFLPFRKDSYSEDY